MGSPHAHRGGRCPPPPLPSCQPLSRSLLPSCQPPSHSSLPFVSATLSASLSATRWHVYNGTSSFPSPLTCARLTAFPPALGSAPSSLSPASPRRYTPGPLRAPSPSSSLSLNGRGTSSFPHFLNIVTERPPRHCSAGPPHVHRSPSSSLSLNGRGTSSFPRFLTCARLTACHPALGSTPSSLPPTSPRR